MKETREMEIFLKNVMWLREHYGISKKHMAELLGIGIASLNKIENGEMPKRLGVEIVFKIYDVFKILPKNQFALELWNLNSDESIRKLKKQRA